MLNKEKGKKQKHQIFSWIKEEFSHWNTARTPDHFVIPKLKKSKGLPQQAEVAQGVPGRLRPWIFLMFQHYKGGRSSAIRTGHLYPRRNPWYSLSEAESTSGHMVLPGELRKKSSLTPPGIDPGTIRLVVQCLNHYATPGPFCYTYVTPIWP